MTASANVFLTQTTEAAAQALAASPDALPGDVVSPAILAPFPHKNPLLDLDMFCSAYAPTLRDVFEGRRFRLEINLGQAQLLFFHGCLMGRVYYEGRCFSFPPFYRNAQGILTWRLDNSGDKFSQHEFFTLPRDILLFFFNLLKLTFEQEALLRPTRHPVAAHILSEVAWPQHVVRSQR